MAIDALLCISNNMLCSFWFQIHVSTLPLSGVKSCFFSAIPLSHFSLKMFRFFLRIVSWKKCDLRALLSVKWNSDDSATSSAKLVGNILLQFDRAMYLFVQFCVFCDLVRAAQGIVGKIRVSLTISAPWRWQTY